MNKALVYKILRKNNQEIKKIDKEIILMMMKCNNWEVETISVMLCLEEHISEYVKDCIKQLRRKPR